MNFKLTGKTRYKIMRKVFGQELVVLEVEESFDDGPDDYHGMPTYLSGRRWRLAKAEDLINSKDI